MRIRLLWTLLALFVFAASDATAQTDFITFESGPVRPMALDGGKLYVVNTPDNRLHIFDVLAGRLIPAGSVAVGMEPVAVAVHAATPRSGW